MKKGVVQVGVIILFSLVMVSVNFAQTQSFLRQSKVATEVDSVTVPSSLETSIEHKIAIAITSAFDWEERPPRGSSFMRRQMHRDTWMKHPAVKNGTILVYFLIGNEQIPVVQGNPLNATHNITELEIERDHYGDIVLLNSSDVHNNGKMNAWYEWASSNIQADYHMKLDDESYLLLDRLLEDSNSWPRHRFLGGQGQHLDRNYIGTGELLKDLSWIRGWGYIMSDDLIQGLGACSRSKMLIWNDGGDHEDTYNAVALRVCGLDSNITFKNSMRFQDLTQVLTQGCPQVMQDLSMLFHGGAVSGQTFAKLPDLTFSRLHNIYFPLKGDLSPAWSKWESLRRLYMEDYRICKGEESKGWSCQGWEYSTCLPKSQSNGKGRPVDKGGRKRKGEEKKN